MGSLINFFLLIIETVTGIKAERKAGVWSWSKFIFTLGFAALEFALIAIPMLFLDQHGPHFGPVLGICCAIAALNFIWFIILMRRWKLPDGRTSLEAYRDANSRR